MGQSLQERQAEYKKKRAVTSVRISVWISRKADKCLSDVARLRGDSREKVVSDLLEQVRT